MVFFDAQDVRILPANICLAFGTEAYSGFGRRHVEGLSIRRLAGFKTLVVSGLRSGVPESAVDRLRGVVGLDMHIHVSEPRNAVLNGWMSRKERA